MSEALRLAETLPENAGALLLIRRQAAAELRRLHTLNSELMEALQKIASTDYRGNQPQEIVIARAALAKAGDGNE